MGGCVLDEKSNDEIENISVLVSPIFFVFLEGVLPLPVWILKRDTRPDPGAADRSC
jgi:hypothetical protein